MITIRTRIRISKCTFKRKLARNSDPKTIAVPPSHLDHGHPSPFPLLRTGRSFNASSIASRRALMVSVSVSVSVSPPTSTIPMSHSSNHSFQRGIAFYRKADYPNALLAFNQVIHFSYAATTKIDVFSL